MTYWLCSFGGSLKPIELIADLCEDQFVPMLTPWSAAFFRLKNIRLPKMQRRVGLPKALNMMVETVSPAIISFIMVNTEHEIALK